MHAFTSALPEHHTIAGLPASANTALVVCGYHPGHQAFYYLLAGAPMTLSAHPPLRRENLTLTELLRWFEELRIGLPGGLNTQLRRDGYAGPDQAWQQFYWGEQGPELRGVIDADNYQQGDFLPLFFGVSPATAASH